MPHRIEVDFDEFGWELITEEAARQGVSPEELVKHAALYFAAESDSGRFSRRPGPFGRAARSAAPPGDETASA